LNFGGWFSQVDAIESKDPTRFRGLIPHLRTFLGADDFHKVARWGFDHVRLPVDWQVAFRVEDLSPREDVLEILDIAVAQARTEGLELILDLHRCPGHDFEDGLHQEQSFFSDPSMRRGCLKVWSVLAERYGHTPGVMLELLNEPVAPSASIWNQVKDELAREIRIHAPKATLVVGSNLWCNASEFAHLTPIDDDNVLYTVHVYNPVLFTHQKAPWVPGDAFREARAYPGDYLPVNASTNGLPMDAGMWNKARMEELLAPVFRFRETHGVRVACNEFGVYMGGPDGQSRMNWLRDLLELFGENQIGWSYWNYKNLDFGIVSQGEGLYDTAPQYANTERTDRDLLELLRAH
jgi:aryl-phospho-beta-D-glucosidase BglC (GH1 family)